MPITFDRRRILQLALGAAGSSLVSPSQTAANEAPLEYPDGRPAATHRLDARDHGIVLRHGDGPNRCDLRGARDLWVFEHGGTFYLLYDGAGPKGWTCCLATSKDLVRWTKHGAILPHGEPGTRDSHYTGYGPTYFENGKWHMFYVAASRSTPPPDYIPATPYFTLKAEADSPRGPWRKRYDIVPFSPQPGTYYADTASPGHIVKIGGEYRMFFSSAVLVSPGIYKRTLGIARTKDLEKPWRVDPEPIVPIEEQIENSGVYYEPANKTWFLFTNHVGVTKDDGEFTESIWVYWTKDPERWDPQHKAIVLDGNNCTWAKRCIGLPAVVPVGRRLAILYDGVPGNRISNMGRHLGLCWLELPLAPPI